MAHLKFETTNKHTNLTNFFPFQCEMTDENKMTTKQNEMKKIFASSNFKVENFLPSPSSL